ncbi:LysR family transcriptional regulator [Halomonas alkalisoli]|uniref:LysR family transcriptional regulator n=1 Tax=Halomonas alkalisoli TaxID=2907158 RepID=UPI001F345067|nr:LysR family transcriptional regulator [Halomonas alkalisoli]MCE9681525.1 LysR family transcriptional regulator [Halomonas alkalisoli]
MSISIRQLKSFIEIAATGSFIEAAENLHISQPALSLSIKKLEGVVGGTLFNRSRKGIQLTPEGKRFLPVARRLVSDWDSALDDLSRLFTKQVGRVSIAALPTLAAGFLPAVLADFKQQYPNLEISVHDLLASQIDDLVSEGRADIGLSVRPRNSEAMHFEPLIEDHFVAVCPIGHPLLCQKEVSWHDLLGYPIIDLDRMSSTRQAIERVLGDLKREMDLFCEVSQIGTVGRMVAAGLGVSALPSLSFLQISKEGLGWRPLISPRVPRQLGIITPTRSPLSAAAEAMLRKIREHVGLAKFESAPLLN